MFGASFGIISQALEIYRKSLDIRNRNVINANDPDYVEENPVVKSFAPVGINFEEVRRDQNIYYLNLRNEKLSLVKYLEGRNDALASVEGMFQELFEGSGVIDYTGRFYTSYMDLMKEPTNEGARGSLYESARALVDFIKTRGRDIDKLDQTLDFGLRRAVDRANELIRKIHAVNMEITVMYAQTYARGRDYKNFLDMRDRYIRELSELINVTLQEDEIGRVKVITSKGFVLVDFMDSYRELEYAGGRIWWGTTDITDVIRSGDIKALLDTREDLSRFKGKLDDFAKQLISEVKLPREGSGTWYLIQNVPDPTVSVSSFGIEGTLEFYDGSTLLGTIDYGPLSLSDLETLINSDPTLTAAGFSATLITNPDGTYTLRIDNSSPSRSVRDTGANFYESSPVFVGSGLADIEVAPTLRSDLEDIDFSLAAVFSSFASGWWDRSEELINLLISDISTTRADVRDELRIESALLESIDRKVKEMQGVSIDKEFMEIMKIQRTYEAVARIVQTIDELLETTLSV